MRTNIKNLPRFTSYSEILGIWCVTNSINFNQSSNKRCEHLNIESGRRGAHANCIISVNIKRAINLCRGKWPVNGEAGSVNLSTKSIIS